MNLAVTVRRDEDLANIEFLIKAVRDVLSVERVTVLEAPQNFDYPYPFPVVTVDEGPQKGRHFGADALSVLKSIANR
jgi:hypothetical protein